MKADGIYHILDIPLLTFTHIKLANPVNASLQEATTLALVADQYYFTPILFLVL